MARDITAVIESSDFACDHLEVYEIRGREKISQPYELVVDVVLLMGDRIAPDDMTGAIVQVVFRDGDVTLRRISGMIAEVTEGLDNQARLRTYRLRVVPRMFRSTLVSLQEVYQQLSVPEIVRAKLDLVDVTCEMDLVGSYPKREFVVQYAETDLAFINRLTEHLGISYHFQERDDGEVLVFTDHNQFRSLPGGRDTIPFRSDGEELDVFALRATTKLVPGFHMVSDYNYRSPLVDLSATCESPVGYAGGIIEFGGHFKSREEGMVLATVRAEEQACRRVVYEGKSDRPQLAAGTHFTLEGHPSFGDVSLLVSEVEHRIRHPGAGWSEGDLAYTNSFRAVPTDVTYRPERITPRPRIDGVVSGIVEPAPDSDGTQPWLDEFGRYRIRLLFDTAPPGDVKASRAMRMAQQHAGAGYGTHFPLRPGTEVLMAFVNGDVDRPIVIGAVPNMVTPTPVTSADHLHHRIRTASGVQIEFEDGF